ncbi:unnamed protein product [Boreogadus saida]
MEEIDSATTSTEPAPSDEGDSTHDSLSANGKTYRFNPQWLKTFNWLVYDQSKKSMFCKYCLEDLFEKKKKASHWLLGTSVFNVTQKKFPVSDTKPVSLNPTTSCGGSRLVDFE